MDLSFFAQAWVSVGVYGCEKPVRSPANMVDD